MPISMTPLLFLALLISVTAAHAAEPFHIYAPSPSTKQLYIVAAKPDGAGLTLTLDKKVELGFAGSSITAHPEKPVLYIASGGGKTGEVPAAVVTLNAEGGYEKHDPIKFQHGTCYLSTDRSARFLLSADYGGGAVDVYALDKAGVPGARVAGLEEGRKTAHAILTSPDNLFAYVPYVKENNALFQYRFDAATGQLTPLEPKNATPPAGTGPRHPAFHPKLPIVYFSNEQQIGISVYNQSETGHLTIRQVADAVPAGESKDGISSSDIVITPDGKFLFAGIRGHSRPFDRISRYRILENGEVTLLGLTPADKIPWGLALSPDGSFLVVTAWEGATLTAYRIGGTGELTKVADLATDKNISDVVTR